MTRHTISLERAIDSISRRELGTDAYNAISNIPGVRKVEIDSESEQLAVISYEWTSLEKFEDAALYLAGYGLVRTGR